MSMPKGWMDAETARPLLKRGTWAHRPNGDLWQIKVLDGPDVAPNADLWRYIGPHPDDESAEPAEVGTIKIEAWVVVGCDEDGTHIGVAACSDRSVAEWVKANAHRGGRSAKIVRLTGYTTPPAPEVVEVVSAEAFDE